MQRGEGGDLVRVQPVLPVEACEGRRPASVQEKMGPERGKGRQDARGQPLLRDVRERGRGSVRGVVGVDQGGQGGGRKGIERVDATACEAQGSSESAAL